MSYSEEYAILWTDLKGWLLGQNDRIEQEPESEPICDWKTTYLTLCFGREC